MNLVILDLDESEVTFDADRNPTGIRYELPHGWEYLKQAVVLWDLVDSRKAAALRQILQREFISERAAGLRFPLLQVASIIDLLEDIENEIRAMTDYYWRVRPESLDAVMTKAPDLVYSFRDDEGPMVYTLENAVAAVLAVRKFLTDAASHGCDVLASP